MSVPAGITPAGTGRRLRQHHDQRRQSTGCGPFSSPAHPSRWAPLAETQRRIAELHWRVVLICGGVIIGTVVVGWFFSLIMIDPFWLLASRPCAINAQSKPGGGPVRGVSEAVEIGEAVEGMLARIGDEQAKTGGGGVRPTRRRGLPTNCGEHR